MKESKGLIFAKNILKETIPVLHYLSDDSFNLLHEFLSKAGLDIDKDGKLIKKLIPLIEQIKN